jgi:hypothetical protein
MFRFTPHQQLATSNQKLVASGAGLFPVSYFLATKPTIGRLPC